MLAEGDDRRGKTQSSRSISDPRSQSPLAGSVIACGAKRLRHVGFCPHTVGRRLERSSVRDEK